MALLIADSMSDRELTLVPKKGRPVTQCQHCRLERKKRSAHVSCECGGVEKPPHPKEKCIHLREAEERAKAGFHTEPSVEKNTAHLTAVAEEQGCCCHHGGTCTCAILKKDGDRDSVTPPRGPAVKPRLEPTKSDGSITVFQNGHHKPVHRKNHLAHEHGMPYKMPMPRAHTDQSVSAKARRSVDSLALDSNMPFNPSPFTPQTSTPFNTERRLSKSEQPSPKLTGNDVVCSTFGNPKLSTMDFSNLGPVQTSQSLQSATSGSYDFTSVDPASGITDSSFDPWSALPSDESMTMPDNNPFGVWATNMDVSGVAQPALTAASSGTQSEIDEIPPMEETYGFGMPSIQEDMGSFNLDNFQAPSSPASNRHSLPPNFFKAMNTGSEWPFNFDSGGSGQRPMNSPQPFDFDNSWEGTNLPPVTDVPRSHPMGGLPNAGRPSSRSVGPSSAPNDNIIQQLFPDIDVGSNCFGATNNAQFFSATGNKASASANLASAPMDFGPMDESEGFTSQPWADGSLSVPNDSFADSYDLNQDFSDPEFSGTWTQ